MCIAGSRCGAIKSDNYKKKKIVVKTALENANKNIW